MTLTALDFVNSIRYLLELREPPPREGDGAEAHRSEQILPVSLPAQPVDYHQPPAVWLRHPEPLGLWERLERLIA